MINPNLSTCCAGDATTWAEQYNAGAEDWLNEYGREMGDAAAAEQVRRRDCISCVWLTAQLHTHMQPCRCCLQTRPHLAALLACFF